jgi:hypothetical protein
LVFIFWDHVPESVLGQVSLRNFGLSDAAEVFVFLAGYSATLAYGGVMARHGYVPAVVRILKRGWTLYVTHIFLMVLLMGVVFVANARVETRDFVAEMHLGNFVVDTEQALVDALTLRFKPNLMDPLPLYIILLLLLAALLPFLARYRAWVIAGSGALYGLTLTLDWNMPGQRGEWWFFNPLAWQFLFVIGAATAIRREALATWWFYRPARAAAVSYLILSALLALSWRWPALHDAIMPTAVAELIYPISKTNLAPLRLLHFLALAFFVAGSPPKAAWLDHPLGRELRRIGRHPLEVFCLGVILAPLADVANTLSGDLMPVQVLTGCAGVAIMFGLARMIEWSREVSRRPEHGAKAVKSSGGGV